METQSNISKGVYRISLDVTHRCNMRCKLCAAHVPYFKDAWHPSYEFLIRSIDEMFRLIPQMDRLVLAGGEPLLRDDFVEILTHLLNYAGRIQNRIEIITNGSIIPEEKLLSICRKFVCRNTGRQGIYFIVDNYGPSLSVHLEEIGEKLKLYGIPHELRDYYENLHCNGWVDFGDFSHKRSPEEAKELFEKCAFPKQLNFCIKIFNGRIDPCSQSLHCMRMGLFDAPAEYIDLFDNSVTVEDKRQKLLSWYSLKELTACQYCDGMCEDSKRFQPAEQLSREELFQIRGK